MAPPGFGRIVGGTQTGVNELPFQAMVIIANSYLCGGTLVSSSFVMTAAHCTKGFSASQITVTLGEHYYSGMGIGQTYLVDQIFQHAGFDDTTGMPLRL